MPFVVGTLIRLAVLALGIGLVVVLLWLALGREPWPASSTAGERAFVTHCIEDRVRARQAADLVTGSYVLRRIAVGCSVDGIVSER